MDDQDKVQKAQNESDIEWQRLELERARLKLDTERVGLEKAKERTTKLQIALPILVSVVAISFSAYSERQRAALEFNRAASSYNEGRFELFKKVTEHAVDSSEIKKAYAEIFPRDSIVLRNEQRDTVGK